MVDDELEGNLGISRRELIKRAAIVGGTLMWAAPVVETIVAKAAYAGNSVAASNCCHCYCDGLNGQTCGVDHFSCQTCKDTCSKYKDPSGNIHDTCPDGTVNHVVDYRHSKDQFGCGCDGPDCYTRPGHQTCASVEC